MKRLISSGGGVCLFALVLAATLVALPTISWSATVALFYDGTYVPTSGDFGDEAYTVSNTLSFLGHTVAPFTGVSSNDFADATAGADVLLIPEVEVGDLFAALAPDAQAAIAEYVAAGGGLIVHATHSSKDENLVNGIFGSSLVQIPSFAFASNLASPIDTAGTAFDGGPDPLPGNDGTYAWDITSIPADARIIYQANVGGVDGAYVVLMPYGAGRVVLLAHDWYNTVPVGSQDAGWPDVLDRAIEEAIHPLRIVDIAIGSPEIHVTFNSTAGEQYTIEYSDGPIADAFSWEPFANPVLGGHLEAEALGTTHTFVDDFTVLSSGGPQPAGANRSYRVRTGAPDAMKKIAVFTDNTYTDEDQEDVNVVFALEALGHHVRTFHGATLEQWAEGTDGADVVVIPDLERGDIAAALDVATRALVSNFVASGRCLILHGGSLQATEHAGDLANAAFGLSVQTANSYYGGSTADLINETGTAFEGGPASLPAQPSGDVGAFLISSLPSGSRSFYEQPGVSNETWVAEIPQGRGSILHLGWDWYAAPPQGSADGGWLEVMDRALQQCCRKRVGYYDMAEAAGDPEQVPPILTAGHDPVDILDLSAAELASIDVLFAQNAYGSYGTEWVNRTSDIAAAVSNGLVLILHDRAIAGASAQTGSILPGGAAITFVTDYDSDLSVQLHGTLVTDGPGGLVGDNTLDGGSSSSHGYAQGATLPTGAWTVLSTAAASSHAVTFAYPYGTGWVVYSSIPLDYYLDGSSPAAFRTIYAPNVVAFGASLAGTP